MPTRLPVPEPGIVEERRQIAESVADLHYTMGTIAESANELIPGEAVDEFKDAWLESEFSMRQLVSDLIGAVPPPTSEPTSPPEDSASSSTSESALPPPSSNRPIQDTALIQHQLTGKVGKAKRATLTRLKDCFFMFWNSAPRNEEMRDKARAAAVEYLDFGSIFVSSIPGYEQAEEVLSLGKKLVEFRTKRGI